MAPALGNTELTLEKPQTSCDHSRELPGMTDGEKLQLLSDHSRRAQSEAAGVTKATLQPPV